MTYTPIVIGSLSWGTPVNDAFTDQDARITDLENAGGETINALGFKAMPGPPELYPSGTRPTSGTVTMVRVDITSPETLSTLTLTVDMVGVTLTAGQNFVGLYDAAGNRVAVSSDQSAAWLSTGEKNIPFTAPYAAAPGAYYLAFLSNGATTPQIFRSVNTAVMASSINHGLSIAEARWTTGPTAQTTLPLSITMGARTLSGTAYWMGVS